ncbi:bifunctional transaldolase/phosoglucose isomerase [Chloroflexota bacterium]
MNAIQGALQQGQAIWLDYIRRGLIKSGEFQQLIEQGITGVTSNPTIFEKAIVGNTDYDAAILALAKADKDTETIYETLVIEDIRTTADLLRPIYDQSSGLHGYVSLEVNPILAHNTDGTIKEAKRLFATLDKPNIMIKVPATPDGIPAIRSLISEGINVNATLIFSLAMYQQVVEAYISGIEELVNRGRNISEVASVASFFLSRIDTVVDAWLEEGLGQGQIQLSDLLGKAAIASAKLAYHAFREAFDSERFAVLKAGGARVQRPLWASTGTKNPAYSDIIYVSSLIGPDTVNTVPPETMDAFLDHGHAVTTIGLAFSEAERTLANLTEAGINMESITAQLLADGVRAFAESFEKLIAGIEDKKARLMAPEQIHPNADIGTFISDVKNTLADLDERNILRRIWQNDHTVWRPEPTEITNRLGWLRITDSMSEITLSLQSFAREIIEAGFHHLVLLGMGGSSLGPEVLKQVFGNTANYLELKVLDSTIPACIQSVKDSIDPAHTLFLVSSKSGTTTESLALFHYFKDLVESHNGRGKAGQSFVAITDPQTPLVKLAEHERFRRIFLNHSDIGGRYSVLSYFGLVPAALLGIDIVRLLQRSDFMRKACASCVPVHDNPGAWLGTFMGTLATRGRDKLTLVTSPTISSFSLWAEQLIAESTGKNGKGIIPVAGEPLTEATHYGEDRLFVYLRLHEDNNSDTDAAIERIRSSGQPILTLEMRDKYDLGAEFYRWEFATSIAGAILGIHPFNQPNVQQSKDATERILREYTTSGTLPIMGNTSSILELLTKAKKGTYLAIMAYLHETPRTNIALAELRRKVVERYGIATTLGYGPRFLHSTGQLHKGGPDEGLFLQIITNHERDIPIPGSPYTFGVISAAQALGDYQALQSLERHIMRIQLSTGDKEDISKIVCELK